MPFIGMIIGSVYKIGHNVSNSTLEFLADTILYYTPLKGVHFPRTKSQDFKEYNSAKCLV